MAWIERHNDESVREGYIRNGCKEVKLFTSALKAFQCNKRIVMAQRKHLEDFYVVELLDDWNVVVPSWKYPRNFESPGVSSPGFGSDSKMMNSLRKRNINPQKHFERLTSLGNGTQSIPPSHIEMHFGLEEERPELRGSFLIGELEGTGGCGYGDIRCDGNFSYADERLVCYWSNRISESVS
ncbi:uncharacterized protein TNCV_3258581 [Trichonephila clavipes]|nr:uncharacterized protein TNCV_3258581 [Trichonephila clavipes]